jgi:hypothetical protein
MTTPPDPPPDLGPSVKKTLDSTTVEILALTVFRAIFGQGVHVPLRVKGVVDVDLVVRDSNVLVNLNEIELTRPQLTIWRVIFAYHGKPVFEYGRGIKRDFKIHFPQLVVLLVTMWKNSRSRRKAIARGELVTDRELITLSESYQVKGAKEGTGS